MFVLLVRWQGLRARKVTRNLKDEAVCHVRRVKRRHLAGLLARDGHQSNGEGLALEAQRQTRDVHHDCLDGCWAYIARNRHSLFVKSGPYTSSCKAWANIFFKKLK